MKRRCTIFMRGWAWCDFYKKCAGTNYDKLVFLHTVGSAGHIVHSSASRLRNIEALFFMVGWAWCGLHTKFTGTRHAKLVFLHPVGYAGVT
jgi:hypothetical protein